MERTEYWERRILYRRGKYTRDICKGVRSCKMEVGLAVIYPEM